MRTGKTLVALEIGKSHDSRIAMQESPDAPEPEASKPLEPPCLMEEEGESLSCLVYHIVQNR